jgi:hypothetical protein
LATLTEKKIPEDLYEKLKQRDRFRSGKGILCERLSPLSGPEAPWHTQPEVIKAADRGEKPPK